jgi:hypothetical protein
VLFLRLRRLADFRFLRPAREPIGPRRRKSGSEVAGGMDETLELPEKIELNCVAIVSVELESIATFSC